VILNLENLLAEAEESSSGLDLLLPATSELVAGVAAFSVVFFFIWKWALPALNVTLENRAAAIEGQIQEAENTKVEAEKLLAEAKSEASAIVEKAKADSEAEKERLASDLKGEVAELSLQISQKVASSMSKDDQQKLIDNFIKELG